MTAAQKAVAFDVLVRSLDQIRDAHGARGFDVDHHLFRSQVADFVIVWRGYLPLQDEKKRRFYGNDTGQWFDWYADGAKRPSRL